MRQQHRSPLEQLVQNTVEDSLDSLAWGFVLVAAIWALPLAAAYAYSHVLDRVTPVPGYDPNRR